MHSVQETAAGTAGIEYIFIVANLPDLAADDAGKTKPASDANYKREPEYILRIYDSRQNEYKQEGGDATTHLCNAH